MYNEEKAFSASQAKKKKKLPHLPKPIFSVGMDKTPECVRQKLSFLFLLGRKHNGINWGTYWAKKNRVKLSFEIKPKIDLN